MLGLVQHLAEHHREHAAEPCEQRDLHEHERRDLGHPDGKARGLHAEGQRDAVGGERCDEAGDEGGEVEHAHADHCHGEDARRNGRAEERREERGHADHDGGALVAVVEAEEAACAQPDRAAHLQRSALAACRAAGEVREDGGEENGGEQLQAQALAGLDLVEHRVGGEPLALEAVVDGDRSESGHGKQVEYPGIRHTELGREVDALVEGRSQKTARHADDDRDHDPAQKDRGIAAQMGDVALGILDIGIEFALERHGSCSHEKYGDLYSIRQPACREQLVR